MLLSSIILTVKYHVSTMRSLSISNAFSACSMLAYFLVAVGCASTYDTPENVVPDVPDGWLQSASEEAVKEEWLSEFDDQKLEDLVEEALAANLELARQAAALDEAKSSAVVAGADRWPSLDAGLEGSSRSESGESRVEAFSSELSASWELDIWGRLSDTQRRAVESMLAAEAGYENARRELAADVASGWYQLISDQSVLNLIKRRVQALATDLGIIESSYAQGIANALDVYLAKTSLLQEQSNEAAQFQTVVESAARLQRLLGRYPSGDWVVGESLPSITSDIPVGLPSDLITRRPDLQQSWHQLLSADASLAVAHKNRFPRLSLTARATDSAASFSDVFDAEDTVRTLIGNLTVPLFRGGELKASEDVAEAQLVQIEKGYLGAVQNAFAEVETAISRQYQLGERLSATEGAQQNAQAGYELSFDQYRRGLVDYATVLQAQLRAFNAETTLIGLQNQLIQNRIALYQAIGGDFEQNQ